MKILVITAKGLFREGIISTLLDFFRVMDKNGMTIDIASGGENHPDVIKEFQSYGCNVINLPHRRKEPIKYIIGLTRCLKNQHYDIIHVHGSSTLMTLELFIAKIAGVKVRIAHSRNTTCEHRLLNKLTRPIFNFSYNVAFACGEDAGKWLFRDNPFIVIHNGKDLNKFKFSQVVRDRIRSQYGLSRERAFGFVGNLVDQKNPEYLMGVFAEIHRMDRNAVLFVIGDGFKKPTLENMAEELGIRSRTFFTGRISNVYEMLSAMDVMLLPSRWEGLPNVVLEWQAAGLPCIISDKITRECAVTDLVHFKSIDIPAEEWAKEALTFLTNDRGSKSAASCRQLIDAGFDLNQNVLKLRKLYFDLLFNKLKR
ncbi:MAG: glycosyltransferase family 1 protein [Prevotella sp.]|nr:glycosyltransferase family 1 protein [Prevotella sp.]